MNIPSHQLSMTVLMSPDMANFSGNVHGGAILKQLDQVAYACASRYAGRYVVTLSVDQAMFLQPIHVGELVTFLASVNHTGTSSMEIGIKVVAEDIRSQVVRHVNSCFFTMVAVDDDKKPAAVPPLSPRTEEEKRRWQGALIRKELRVVYTSSRASGGGAGCPQPRVDPGFHSWLSLFSEDFRLFFIRKWLESGLGSYEVPSSASSPCRSRVPRRSYSARRWYTTVGRPTPMRAAI